MKQCLYSILESNSAFLRLQKLLRAANFKKDQSSLVAPLDPTYLFLKAKLYIYIFSFPPHLRNAPSGPPRLPPRNSLPTLYNNNSNQSYFNRPNNGYFGLSTGYANGYMGGYSPYGFYGNSSIYPNQYPQSR